MLLYVVCMLTKLYGMLEFACPLYHNVNVSHIFLVLTCTCFSTCLNVHAVPKKCMFLHMKCMLLCLNCIACFRGEDDQILFIPQKISLMSSIVNSTCEMLKLNFSFSVTSFCFCFMVLISVLNTNFKFIYFTKKLSIEVAGKLNYYSLLIYF